MQQIDIGVGASGFNCIRMKDIEQEPVQVVVYSTYKCMDELNGMKFGKCVV